MNDETIASLGDEFAKRDQRIHQLESALKWCAEELKFLQQWVRQCKCCTSASKRAAEQRVEIAIYAAKAALEEGK